MSTKPILTEEDFERAAKELNCDVAAIKAVCEVEAPKGGFLDDGRPTILFERHKFHKFTGGRFSAQHPDISSSKPGGYGAAGAHQWRRFSQAFALDPKAAMKSCSWGKFQIMGFNFKSAGFDTIDAFVDAMKVSEGEQLLAFVNIIKSFALADELKGHQWLRFAAAYNGPNYRINHYDTKLAAAHKKHSRAAGVPVVGASVIDDVEVIEDETTAAVEMDDLEPEENATVAVVDQPPASPQVAPKVPIDPDAVVEVKQAEPIESPVLKGIKTHYAAISGFVTMVLGGAVSFLRGLPAPLMYGFFGFAALIVCTYIVTRTITRNHENQRQLRREEMAHELTMLQMKTASDPDAYTVKVTQ